MRSFIELLVADFVLQGYAKELAAGRIKDTQGSMDEVVNKLTNELVNRGLTAWHLPQTDLDKTVLVKTQNLKRMFHGTAYINHPFIIRQSHLENVQILRSLPVSRVHKEERYYPLDVFAHNKQAKEATTAVRHRSGSVRTQTGTWNVAFFDLDDCLYKNNWATAKKLNDRFDDYTTSVLNLEPGEADRLYKQYGTCLAGLVKERIISESEVQAFLDYAHDIDLEDIKPDPQLAEMLKQVNCRRWVFTASAPEHAERCLGVLGVRDLFEGVVAASSIEMFNRAGYVTKYDPKCFEAAMDMAGVVDPKECIFMDDNVKNIRTAKMFGWHAVLVGRALQDGRKVDCPEADVAIDKIGDLLQAVPELCGRRGQGTATSDFNRL